MTFRIRSLTSTMLLSASLVAVSACGDDDPVTTPPPPAPTNPAPTGLAATATGTTTINVSWSAPATAATEFVLQRATGAAGAFAEVSRPAGGATTYADQGLTAATLYRYRLAAVRSGATSTFSAEASATTESPAGPSIVDVTTDITVNTTWTANNIYRLKGFRKVGNGATLTIEPGTRIEGDFDVVGSSLFVLRGARLIAEGTAQSPIVFTSSRAEGQRQPGDWGGLIIVGNARINRSGVVNIEGTGTSTDNPLLNYAGGVNDADNSGSLRYVRVEFAGFGPAQDAELNSFTLAALGSGTQLDFLQVMAGLDDSFEWFGGMADAKHLVSYESGDDHFDSSEGFQGRVQFAIAYQSKLLAPRAGAGNVSSDPQGIENDGCGSNAGGGCDLGFNSTPLTIPVFANFTLVGTGPGVVGASGSNGMVLRRGVGGHYVNGILARWVTGIAYRDAQSKQRETDGLLSLKGLFVAETPTLFQAGQQVYDGPPSDIEHVAATTAASLFTLFPTNPNSAADFDWSLAAGVAPRTGGVTSFTGDLATRAGAAVTGTSYRGAADPSGAKWWAGWTVYADN
ncbi:MAG: hypothetical protein CVV20_00610 [Gemmatimonadetes bacterium HGW-Gemmatimonadetes-1]|nr:MAG: hypothetical protein CVV20_00610 [Gemmatimonadetes bacterium HGW-Gemmatimonadetes-1]